MKTTQTALAVGLAIIVVGAVFVFPSLNPFKSIGVSVQAQQQSATTTSTSQQISALTTMTTNDGLQITDEVVGNGAIAESGDSVTVNYVGSLTNGKVIDASANHGTSGFTFTLGAGQVIKGWDEGVVGMKVGGKRKLVIPAALAYGNQEVGGGLIPANSTLIFEVELLNVQKARGQ